MAFWHSWLRRNTKEQRAVCQRAVTKGSDLRYAGMNRCGHVVVGTKTDTENLTRSRTGQVMTHN